MPSLCSASPAWDVLYIYCWLPLAVLLVMILLLIIEYYSPVAISAEASAIIVMVVGFLMPIYLMYKRFSAIRADCKNDCTLVSKSSSEAKKDKVDI